MYPLTSAWAAKTAAIHGIKRWLWSVKSIAFCIVISNLERSRNRIYTGFLNFSGISEEVIDGFRWQLVVVKLFWAVWCYCLPPTKEESYVFARVRLSVCLSICEQDYSKNACMDLDEMLRVDGMSGHGRTD